MLHVGEEWYGFAFEVVFDEDYVELFHEDMVDAGLEPVYEVGIHRAEMGPHVLGQGRTGAEPGGEEPVFAYPSLDDYLFDFGPDHVYLRLKGRHVTEDGAFTYPVVDEFPAESASIDYDVEQVDEMVERERRLRENGFDVTTVMEFSLTNTALSDLVGEALGVSDASWEEPGSFFDVFVHTPRLRVEHPENEATFLVGYGEQDGTPRITTTEQPRGTAAYDVERQIRTILED